MQGTLWILVVVASAAQPQSQACPQTLNLQYNGPDAALKEGAKDAFKPFNKLSEQAYQSTDGKHFFSRCSSNSWQLTETQGGCGGAVVFNSSPFCCFNDRGSFQVSYFPSTEPGSASRVSTVPGNQVSGLQGCTPPPRPGGGGRPGGPNGNGGNQPTNPGPATTPFPVATNPQVQPNGEGKSFQKMLIFGGIGVALLLLCLVAIMCIPCGAKK